MFQCFEILFLLRQIAPNNCKSAHPRHDLIRLMDHASSVMFTRTKYQLEQHAVHRQTAPQEQCSQVVRSRQHTVGRLIIHYPRQTQPIESRSQNDRPRQRAAGRCYVLLPRSLTIAVNRTFTSTHQSGQENQEYRCTSI